MGRREQPVAHWSNRRRKSSAICSITCVKLEEGGTSCLLKIKEPDIRIGLTALRPDHRCEITVQEGVLRAAQVQPMFYTFPPPAPLAPFVASLWVYDSDPPMPGEPAHIPERALPTGLTDLMISLRSDHDGDLWAFDRRRSAAAESLPPAMLRGAHSAWYDLEVASMRSQVGVRFKAGGAAPFLPMPAHELHNLHVPLHALWGAQARELHERLLAAPTPAACAGILAHALLAQTAQPPAHHPAVAYALQVFRASPRPQAIGCVVEQVGLSHRRFDALFRAEVGLIPKQFCRVRRFTRVIRRAAKGPPVSWASLAIECGYYDQAHLINDFRAFAGMTPTAYLRYQRTRFLDYVIFESNDATGDSPCSHSATRREHCALDPERKQIA